MSTRLSGHDVQPRILRISPTHKLWLRLFLSDERLLLWEDDFEESIVVRGDDGVRPDRLQGDQFAVKSWILDVVQGSGRQLVEVLGNCVLDVCSLGYATSEQLRRKFILARGPRPFLATFRKSLAMAGELPRDWP